MGKTGERVGYKKEKAACGGRVVKEHFIPLREKTSIR